MVRADISPRLEACQRVAVETLSVFQQESNQRIPPVPIDFVAKWLGLTVVPLFSIPMECSAIVSTRDKLIGVNAKHHSRRRRFSIAHELGHILMKHRPESKCTREEIFQFNMEADFCASALLMPDVEVVKVLEEGKTSEVLAHLFDVSEDAMKRKLDYLQKSRLL